jgi:hypothetical protein
LEVWNSLAQLAATQLHKGMQIQVGPHSPKISLFIFQLSDLSLGVFHVHMTWSALRHDQVVGRLKTEEWTDKMTGQPRRSFKIVADQVNKVRPWAVVSVLVHDP